MTEPFRFVNMDTLMLTFGEIMDDYVKAYCLVALIFAFIQTAIMLKDPPDRVFPVLTFYVAAIFLPIIVVTAFPVITYRVIDQAWTNSLKRDRQRVRRH